MPTAPLAYCTTSGCVNRVPSGACPTHRHAHRQHQRRFYSQPGQFNYGRRWGKVSKNYLDRHPLCVQCLAEGRSVFATETDHIIPHRGNPELQWDEANFQPLCKSHHSAKTARELKS